MRGNVQSRARLCKALINKSIKFLDSVEGLYKFIEHEDSSMTEKLISSIINPKNIDKKEAFDNYKSNMMVAYLMDLEKEKNHYLMKKQIDKRFDSPLNTEDSRNILADHFESVLNIARDKIAKGLSADAGT